MPKMIPTDEVIDVAVVGAGISGVYSAWRLLTSTGPRTNASGNKPDVDAGVGARNVVLFESSDRVGGRLLSLVPPGIPDARVEIGGMRYTSSHLQVAGLVSYLGLATEPFTVAQPENLAYVRGKRLRTKELGNARMIPYDISPKDLEGLQEGITALAAKNFLKIVLNTTKVDLKTVDWLAVAKTGRYEGRKLTDLSMRYLFTRSVGHEAFQYAYDTSGYDSIFHTWNAADGFPWNLDDYGAAVTYSHVTDGYLQVALKLQEKFEAAGGSVQLKHRLVSFDAVTLVDGTPGVELKVARGAKGQMITILARHLVLAMPRRSIELLDESGVVLEPKNTAVRALIQSVTPIPLFKIALAYNTRWWEQLGITKGQTVTDLPVRQCYYWPVEDPKSKKGIILVYDDGQDLEYWASLRSLAHNDAFADQSKNPAKPGALPNWHEFRAPKLMVNEVHRQLLEIHGIKARKQYEPYSAAYHDWGCDPFGGGANFWPLHVESHVVSKKILKPMPNVPVHVCGDAYSHAQGWVEGALATAEEMLQAHFGLGDPPAPLVSPT
ncbi:MAG: FAD-dependent oxidoreductase [Gemmatimonadaceae bacterium]